MEIWRDIQSHADYQVSNLGRVRSNDHVSIDTNGRRMQFRGCIRKLYLDKDGRQRVTLRGVNFLVHHLVLVAFVGPRPHAMEGCHEDGDAAHNWVTNLRWGTRESNVDDVYRHQARRRDPRAMLPRLHGRALVSAYLSGMSGLV